MKTIIAGSRGITDLDTVWRAVHNSGFQITEVVSGGAKGVDQLGEKIARQFEVPVKVFLPRWDSEGPGAALNRNIAMAEYADALIAVWDGVSRGTKHMIKVARNRNLQVYVYQL